MSMSDKDTKQKAILKTAYCNTATTTKNLHIRIILEATDEVVDEIKLVLEALM
jgi:hypothetical protein